MDSRIALKIKLSGWNFGVGLPRLRAIENPLLVVKWEDNDPWQ